MISRVRLSVRHCVQVNLAATTSDTKQHPLIYSFQDLCHIGEVVARETVVRDKVPGGGYLQTLLLPDINRYVYEIRILNMYM